MSHHAPKTTKQALPQNFPVEPVTYTTLSAPGLSPVLKNPDVFRGNSVKTCPTQSGKLIYQRYQDIFFVIFHGKVLTFSMLLNVCGYLAL